MSKNTLSSVACLLLAIIALVLKNFDAVYVYSAATLVLAGIDNA